MGDMLKTENRHAAELNRCMGIYALTFAVGLVLRIAGLPYPPPYYETFKNITPFILTIPKAYLGYCF